ASTRTASTVHNTPRWRWSTSRSKVPNYGLWQEAILRSGGYKSCEVLSTARVGRDVQQQLQKVHIRRLQQNAIVWSGRFENGGILHSTPWKGWSTSNTLSAEPKVA
ncbi:unnamed protein product, partial [Ascophyllum nodosum]